MRYIFFTFLALSLTGCLEIIEEVNLNDDGSGELIYTLNLSQSKTKINSIQLLDSLNGMKIPDENDIRTKANETLAVIKNMAGISKADVEFNFDDYIFKFNCSFNNVEALNNAAVVLKETYNIKDPYANDDNHYTFDRSSKVFRRKGDYSGKADLSEVEDDDLALLENANFTGIYRFNSEIKSVTNEDAKVSPNRKATMIKVKIVDLITKRKKIENTAYLD